MNVKGVIERMSVKQIDTKNGVQTKTSIMLDGEWYSMFGNADIDGGNTVSIDYESKTVGGKVYHNIKNIELIPDVDNRPENQDKPETTPREALVKKHLAGDRTHLSILKQVAFKGAIELAKGKENQDNNFILCDAEEFYKWLKGEDD